MVVITSDLTCLIRLIGSLICCMQFGGRNFGTGPNIEEEGTKVR